MSSAYSDVEVEVTLRLVTPVDETIYICIENLVFWNSCLNHIQNFCEGIWGFTRNIFLLSVSQVLRNTLKGEVALLNIYHYTEEAHITCINTLKDWKHEELVEGTSALPK